MATAYVNGYQPYAFADFSGGINLRDKSDTVGDKEAIDLLNVTFTERGAIRQRDGYADLTTADLTNRVDSLAPFYTAGGHPAARSPDAAPGSRRSAPPAPSSPPRPGCRRAVQRSRGSPTPARVHVRRQRHRHPAALGRLRVDGADRHRQRDRRLSDAEGRQRSPSPPRARHHLAARTPRTGSSPPRSAPRRPRARRHRDHPVAWFFSNAGQPEIWETDGASGRGATSGT
jgi:hypothetical protein